MAGRRSHSRFVFVNRWQGVLRVLSGVLVERTSRDEFVAISHVPAIVDEEMSFELLSAGGAVSLGVKVMESRPVIVEGALRHRLRLQLVERTQADGALAIPPRVATEAV